MKYRSWRRCLGFDSMSWMRSNSGNMIICSMGISGIYSINVIVDIIFAISSAWILMPRVMIQ